jgi:hypothetical protein
MFDEGQCSSDGKLRVGIGIGEDKEARSIMSDTKANLTIIARNAALSGGSNMDPEVLKEG